MLISWTFLDAATTTTVGFSLRAAPPHQHIPPGKNANKSSTKIDHKSNTKSSPKSKSKSINDVALMPHTVVTQGSVGLCYALMAKSLNGTSLAAEYSSAGIISGAAPVGLTTCEVIRAIIVQYSLQFLHGL